MAINRIRLNKPTAGLTKCLTGIHGLDEITLGGLPGGRPTLVCDVAGCGKTLPATKFLAREQLSSGAGV